MTSNGQVAITGKHEVTRYWLNGRQPVYFFIACPPLSVKENCYIGESIQTDKHYRVHTGRERGNWRGRGSK